MNPDLAVTDFVTFANQVEVNFSQQAMIAKLTSLFFMQWGGGGSAFTVSPAYSVGRRTNETRNLHGARRGPKQHVDFWSCGEPWLKWELRW